jgi:hypothetical protein
MPGETVGSRAGSAPPQTPPLPGSLDARKGGYETYIEGLEAARKKLEDTYGVVVSPVTSISGDEIARLLRTILASKVQWTRRVHTLEDVATLAGAAERNWEVTIRSKEAELEGLQAVREEDEEQREERQKGLGDGGGHDWDEAEVYGGYGGYGETPTLVGIKTQVDDLTHQLKEIKDLILYTQATPSQTQTTAFSASPTGSQPTLSTSPSHSATFAQVVASSPGPATEAAKFLAKERANARTEIQDRQVLVTLDKAQYEYYKAGDGVTVHSKAKSIAKAKFPGEEEKYVLRAVKFIDGNGMVLEVKYADTAARLRTEEGKTFVEGFGGGASAQPKLVFVVAKFVPVSLDVNAPTTTEHMASSNDIQSGVINKVSWCRRTAFPATQKVALLRVGFTLKAAANHAITNGLSLRTRGYSVGGRRTNPCNATTVSDMDTWGSTARRARGDYAAPGAGANTN